MYEEENTKEHPFIGMAFVAKEVLDVDSPVPWAASHNKEQEAEEDEKDSMWDCIQGIGEARVVWDVVLVPGKTIKEVEVGTVYPTEPLPAIWPHD